MKYGNKDLGVDASMAVRSGSMEVGGIENRIYLIRGQKVMLDRDLAELYGVETKYLNRQVKRNQERFPEQYMFQLAQPEKDELVTNWHRFATLKHSTSLPYAFTEHGVAMLSAVLNSARAIKVSIMIVNAFIRLRSMLANHQELVGLFQKLESRVDSHDDAIKVIIEEIRKIVEIQIKPKSRIGFLVKKDH